MYMAFYRAQCFPQRNELIRLHAETLGVPLLGADLRLWFVRNPTRLLHLRRPDLFVEGFGTVADDDWKAIVASATRLGDWLLHLGMDCRPGDTQHSAPGGIDVHIGATKSAAGAGAIYKIAQPNDGSVLLCHVHCIRICNSRVALRDGCLQCGPCSAGGWHWSGFMVRHYCAGHAGDWPYV